MSLCLILSPFLGIIKENKSTLDIFLTADMHHLTLFPSLDILRFRAKTLPKMKGKLQAVTNWHPLEGIGLKKFT